MPFQSEKQRKYLYSQKPEVAEKLAQHGKMLEVEEADLIGKAKGPMKMIGECDKCMVGKCGCGEKKKSLPMIGKADEYLDAALPLEVKELISQMPLEMQATQLGGAGSTDIRPTLDQMNYELPSRNIGRCGTCDHACREGQALVCHALKYDPPVAPAAHCDLWTGGRHMVGKARNGAGPTVPYGEQSMPDYEMLYHITPKTADAKRERRMNDERRRATAERNSGRYGIHGAAPEPVISNTPDKWPSIIPARPEKFQTKPLVQAPVIQTKHPTQSTRSRLFLMERQRPADTTTYDVPQEPKVRALKKGRAFIMRKSLDNAAPMSDDPQSGQAQAELQWFSDEESAARYCHGKDGLYPIPVDSRAAKIYGVMMGGWLVCDAESGIFEVLR
jgi:hypothetical protein